MSCGERLNKDRNGEEFLKEHFPYVKRGPDGEFIIPARKIEEFVTKYQTLSDNADHLERLRQYRAGGQRVKPSELDD